MKNEKEQKKKKEKKLRPIWYTTDFFCDDKLILKIGGTQKKIVIETWSGNHPIFSVQKNQDESDNFKFFLL